MTYVPVPPLRPLTRYFVVHTFPDADAIGASWLGARMIFPRLFPGEVVEPCFIPFNDIDPDTLARATAVFDIGGTFDPLCLRFDHHLAKNPRSTCATRMVWEYLMRGTSEQHALCPELTYLMPIVDLIEAGDTGELDARGYGLSRTLGLHALLLGFRFQAEAAALAGSEVCDTSSEISLLTSIDRATLQYGWGLLDALVCNQQRQHDATTRLHDRIVYRSADGLVWGLQDAPHGSVSAAFAQGACLVVIDFHYPLPTSYMLEVYAMPTTPGLDMRNLLQQARQEAIMHGISAMCQELELFYCEKTYAGRGSPKAPNPTPPRISVIELSQALDRLWRR